MDAVEQAGWGGLDRQAGLSMVDGDERGGYDRVSID